MLEQGYFHVTDLYKVASDIAVLPNIPKFPLDFVETLPQECPECGADTLITTTLSILKCGSDMCSGKSAQRLVSLIKDIGVLNMGLSKSKAFFEYYQTQNPYAIFAFEPLADDGTPAPHGAHILAENVSHEVSVKIFKQVDKKRSMTLAEYVKIGNLPGIRDSSLDIFGSYDSLTEFYNDFEGAEEGTVSFIQEKLRISNTKISVKAIEIAKVLLNHKDELFEFIDYVHIKKKTVANDATGDYKEVPTINICLSTSVGAPYRSKVDFVDQMKERFGDNITINVLGGVSNICNVLVWSKSGAETSKVRKAKTINEKAGYEKIKILTGTEFKEHLETLE